MRRYRSLLSKTGLKYFHSSQNAGGNRYGAHSMIARNPLSWNTRWNGLAGVVCAAGIASSVPSFLSLMLNSASTLCASMPPYGFFQQRRTCSLNNAPHVAELSAALPLTRPSAALEFSVSPAAAFRDGSRLSSNAATVSYTHL